MVCSIKEHFDQPGECVLVKAVKEDYGEELKYMVDFYMDNFNHDQLKMQLGVLSSNISNESAQDLKSTKS